jgi:hydrogenase maturation protease
VEALTSPISFPFDFPTHREVEPVRGDIGNVVGVIVREWEHLSGSVEIKAERLLDDISGLRVLIRNQSPFAPRPEGRREDAVPFSLVSAHTILGVQDGEFISLLEPPLNCESLAAGCQNVGTWPVLVGEHDSRQAMLSSPLSSTTIRRLLRKVRAASSTERRSTKFSRCGL